MKKFLIALVLLGLIALIAIPAKKKHVADTRNASALSGVSHHDLILEKAKGPPVKSQFEPVLLYRSSDNVKFIFTGCGSLYIGSNGQQVVTAEHLFLKDYGTQQFIWRKTKSLDETGIIESVMHRSSEVANAINGAGDIVILKTGDLKPIVCFSNEPAGGVTDHMEVEIQALSVRMMATSLTSGQQVRILGRSMRVDGQGSAYMLLEYDSVTGESGSGFVDAEDNLYVLKGQPMNMSGEHKAAIQATLGNPSAISLAYGPLKLSE